MKTDTQTVDLWRMIAIVVELQSLEMTRLWAIWDGYFDKRPTRRNRDWLERRLAHAIQNRDRDVEKVGAAIEMLEPVNIVALYRECRRLCPDCLPRDLLAAIMDTFSDGQYSG